MRASCSARTAWSSRRGERRWVGDGGADQPVESVVILYADVVAVGRRDAAKRKPAAELALEGLGVASECRPRSLKAGLSDLSVRAGLALHADVADCCAFGPDGLLCPAQRVVRVQRVQG